jgi:hypothetical protein
MPTVMGSQHGKRGEQDERVLVASINTSATCTVVPQITDLRAEVTDPTRTPGGGQAGWLPGSVGEPGQPGATTPHVGDFPLAPVTR